MARFKKEKLGIYGIYLGDTCLYVGRGELKDRHSYHWSRCRNNKHKNVGLQRYWDEYNGEVNFEFRTLGNCTKKEYQEKEDYWIKKCKPLFNKNKASSCSYKTNTYKKKKVKEHRSEINKGEKNPRSKYSEDLILWIKHQLLVNQLSVKEVAEITGISNSYLSQIKTGRKWSYLEVL